MIKNHRIFMLLISVLLVGGLVSCGVKSRIKQADKKYAIGEYYDAAEIYKATYKRISPQKDKALKSQVAFHQGECYRILNNSKAVSAYQNAIRYKYPDSIAFLRLAQVLQYQGKYKEAEKNYKIYLNNYPDNYVAQAGKYACQQINEWKNQSSRYKVTATKEFNQKKTSNFAPAFVGEDSEALMFTSNRQEKKSNVKKMVRPSPVTGEQTFNIYSTRKDANGAWEAIELPEGLYEEYNEQSESDSENDSVSGGKSGTAELGVCCFTADGKTMYFTYSKPINGQDLGAKIYSTSRTGGVWGEPQEVVLFPDSSISVGHPSINSSGDTLYFASDAPDGYGGKDIWMAEYDGSTWGNVHNLGPQINSTDDELFPYIRSNGTLYFSSKGHPGYGGLDLYMANLKDSTWDIFNMGAPFNSNGDDFGITFAGETESGYFSSNRGQKKGYDQIYSFVLPEMTFAVEGTVSDNNGDPIVDGTLRLIGNDGTNKKLQIRKDGTYHLKLQKNAEYAMLVTCRGYLNAKQQLSTEGEKDSKTYTKNFTLAPVSKPVTMNNIFYEFGKWTLTSESENGLQELIKLLNDNPNITIELSAHTDMVGDSVFNKTLSEKRAQSVVDYLIANGIDKERLTPVGYGKYKPVVADQTIHKKYAFIPVEQILNEAFILSLTEEQQEICNQINRRTEFKVLKTTYKLY